MRTVILFVAGWLTWTLSEYVLHRWLMHALRRGLLYREHLRHHAQPRNIGWRSNVATLSRMGLVPLAAALAGGLDGSGGIAIAAGWIFGYESYEILHWRSHDFAPLPALGGYDRWLRRRHLHHHAVRPTANFGVTVDFWDRAFGTWERPGKISAPGT